LSNRVFPENGIRQKEIPSTEIFVIVTKQMQAPHHGHYCKQTSGNQTQFLPLSSCLQKVYCEKNTHVYIKDKFYFVKVCSINFMRLYHPATI